MSEELYMTEQVVESVLDSGNTAWIVVATILVLMMTIPGLALFYGGLVRRKNILSTFYMPSFYGKGIRLALSAKFEITPQLTLSAKAGYTNYFNRDIIGSGTEQINGNSRTDLYTYLRWRF
jgi:ammonia channel protein AmtB